MTAPTVRTKKPNYTATVGSEAGLSNGFGVYDRSVLSGDRLDFAGLPDQNKDQILEREVLFDDSASVGYGQCIDLCKVGIDVRLVQPVELQTGDYGRELIGGFNAGR